MRIWSGWSKRVQCPGCSFPKILCTHRRARRVFLPVSAGVLGVWVAFEASDRVFHLWYLGEMAEHEGFEGLFGRLFDGSNT